MIKMNQLLSIDELKNIIVNDVNIVYSVFISCCRYVYGDCWLKGLLSKCVNFNIFGFLIKRYFEVFQLGMFYIVIIINYS